MMKQIRTLTKLQLQNLYGLNVFRYTKDKKKRKTTIGLGVVWTLLIVMIATYIGGATFGYVYLGMAEIVPAYLIMLSSMVILAFAIFKAGSIIFQENAYDILCSLPVNQIAIVVSRFLRMYVENLLLTVLVMVPGIIVYGVMVKPTISFYVIGVVVMLFVPLIPITIATFIGALITAISSRMKHKSLVSATLSIAIVVGVLGGTGQMEKLEENFSIEMIQNLSGILTQVIKDVYPPAIWLGNAMVKGDVLIGLLCVLGGLTAFVVTIALVSAKFHEICRGLYSTHAKHNYKMEQLKTTSVLGTLYKREMKRYFASSIYVQNTIVGPVLAVVFAGAVLGIGIDTIQQAMGIPLDITGCVPILLAGIFSMMTTTCTSVSMEGKEWWIVKSLPIRTKDLLDSKLLFGLSLYLPFWLVAEILLMIALRPEFMELVWMVLLPLILIVFSQVFGLTINLKMPIFDWENEVSVVKQSASSAIGGLGGFVVILACMVPVLLVPMEYSNLVKSVLCIVFAGVTWILYQKNNKANLQELEYNSTSR